MILVFTCFCQFSCIYMSLTNRALSRTQGTRSKRASGSTIGQSSCPHHWKHGESLACYRFLEKNYYVNLNQISNLQPLATPLTASMIENLKTRLFIGSYYCYFYPVTTSQPLFAFCEIPGDIGLGKEAKETTR